MNELEDQIKVLKYFIVTWAVIGVLVFELNCINGKIKKVLYPFFIIMMTVTVIWLMAKDVSGWQLYAVGYPSIILISIWAIWHNRFCQSCGKPNVNLNSFHRTKNCKKCGELIK